MMNVVDEGVVEEAESYHPLSEATARLRDAVVLRFPLETLVQQLVERTLALSYAEGFGRASTALETLADACALCVTEDDVAAAIAKDAVLGQIARVVFADAVAAEQVCGRFAVLCSGHVPGRDAVPSTAGRLRLAHHWLWHLAVRAAVDPEMHRAAPSIAVPIARMAAPSLEASSRDARAVVSELLPARPPAAVAPILSLLGMAAALTVDGCAYHGTSPLWSRRASAVTTTVAPLVTLRTIESTFHAIVLRAGPGAFGKPGSPERRDAAEARGRLFGCFGPLLAAASSDTLVAASPADEGDVPTRGGGGLATALLDVLQRLVHTLDVALAVVAPSSARWLNQRPLTHFDPATATPESTAGIAAAVGYHHAADQHQGATEATTVGDELGYEWFVFGRGTLIARQPPGKRFVPHPRPLGSFLYALESLPKTLQLKAAVASAMSVVLSVGVLRIRGDAVENITAAVSSIASEAVAFALHSSSEEEDPLQSFQIIKHAVLEVLDDMLNTLGMLLGDSYAAAATQQEVWLAAAKASGSSPSLCEALVQRAATSTGGHSSLADIVDTLPLSVTLALALTAIEAPEEKEGEPSDDVRMAALSNVAARPSPQPLAEACRPVLPRLMPLCLTTTSPKRHSGARSAALPPVLAFAVLLCALESSDPEHVDAAASQVALELQHAAAAVDDAYEGSPFRLTSVPPATAAVSDPFANLLCAALLNAEASDSRTRQRTDDVVRALASLTALCLAQRDAVRRVTGGRTASRAALQHATEALAATGASVSNASVLLPLISGFRERLLRKDLYAVLGSPLAEALARCPDLDVDPEATTFVREFARSPHHALALDPSCWAAVVGWCVRRGGFSPNADVVSTVISCASNPRVRTADVVAAVTALQAAFTEELGQRFEDSILWRQIDPVVALDAVRDAASHEEDSSLAALLGGAGSLKRAVEWVSNGVGASLRLTLRREESLESSRRAAIAADEAEARARLAGSSASRIAALEAAAKKRAEAAAKAEAVRAQQEAEREAARKAKKEAEAKAAPAAGNAQEQQRHAATAEARQGTVKKRRVLGEWQALLHRLAVPNSEVTATMARIERDFRDRADFPLEWTTQQFLECVVAGDPDLPATADDVELHVSRAVVIIDDARMARRGKAGSSGGAATSAAGKGKQAKKKKQQQASSPASATATVPDEDFWADVAAAHGDVEDAAAADDGEVDAAPSAAESARARILDRFCQNLHFRLGPVLDSFDVSSTDADLPVAADRNRAFARLVDEIDEYARRERLWRISNQQQDGAAPSASEQVPPKPRSTTGSLQKKAAAKRPAVEEPSPPSPEANLLADQGVPVGYLKRVCDPATLERIPESQGQLPVLLDDLQKRGLLKVARNAGLCFVTPFAQVWHRRFALKGASFGEQRRAAQEALRQKLDEEERRREQQREARRAKRKAKAERVREAKEAAAADATAAAAAAAKEEADKEASARADDDANSGVGGAAAVATVESSSSSSDTDADPDEAYVTPAEDAVETAAEPASPRHVPDWLQGHEEEDLWEVLGVEAMLRRRQAEKMSTAVAPKSGKDASQKKKRKKRAAAGATGHDRNGGDSDVDGNARAVDTSGEAPKPRERRRGDNAEKAKDSAAAAAPVAPAAVRKKVGAALRPTAPTVCGVRRATLVRTAQWLLVVAVVFGMVLLIALEMVEGGLQRAGQPVFG